MGIQATPKTGWWSPLRPLLLASMGFGLMSASGHAPLQAESLAAAPAADLRGIAHTMLQRAEAQPPALPDHLLDTSQQASTPEVKLGEWSALTKADGGLPSDVVHEVQTDRAGRLWVTGDFGLAVYDEAAKKWTTYADAKAPAPFDVRSRPTSLALDASSTPWRALRYAYEFEARCFLLRLDPSSGNWLLKGEWRRPLDAGITGTCQVVAAGDSVFQAAYDKVHRFGPDGALAGSWAVGGTGVMAIAAGLTRAEGAPVGCEPQPSPEAWFVWRAGNLDILSVLGKFRSGGACVFAVQMAQETQAISSKPSVSVDPLSRVWVGGYGGSDPAVLRFDRRAGEVRWLRASNSGLTHAVRNAFSDPSGRVWFGQSDAIASQLSHVMQVTPDSDQHDPHTLPLKVTLNVFDQGTWCSFEPGGGNCASAIPAGNRSAYVLSGAALSERTLFVPGNRDGGSLGIGLDSVALNWKTLTPGNSGMVSDVVNALWMDKGEGRLWLAPPVGVTRFDSRWRTWTLEEAAAPNGSTVRVLHRDLVGRLWAATVAADGTTQRLWVQDSASDEWVREVTVPVAQAVTSMSSDTRPTRRVWLGTQGAGVSVFDPSSRAWTALQAGLTPLTSNNVFVVARDAQGRMWMGTDKGITVFDFDTAGQQWTTYTKASTSGGLVSDVVKSVTFDGSGRVWFGTAAGVSVLDGTTWTSHTKASTAGGLADDDIRAITVDQSNRLWFATGAGLSTFDGAVWQRYSRWNSGLPVEDVRLLTSDQDNRVWQVTPAGLTVRGNPLAPIGLPAPTVTGLTPTSGPVGTVVDISGANFYFGDADTNRVFFTGPGGTYAQATVLSVEGTPAVGKLRVIVPFNAIKGPITVSHAGGTAASASFAPIPTAWWHSPTGGSAGAEITVYGANLGGAARIRFANGVEAPSLNPMSGNTLTVRVPQDAATGNLTVVTDGGSVVLAPPFVVSQVCGFSRKGVCTPNQREAIEVNQGLPQDRAVLVTGKPTLIRVYIGTTNTAAPALVESARLTLRGVDGSVTTRVIGVNRTFGNKVQEYDLTRNINFWFDRAELRSFFYHGQMELLAGNVVVYSAQFSFQLLSPTTWTLTQANFVTPSAKNPSQSDLNYAEAQIQGALETLERVLPVTFLRINHRWTHPVPWQGPGGYAKIGCDEWWGFLWMEGKEAWDLEFNPYNPAWRRSDHVVGVVPSYVPGGLGPCCGGCGGSPWLLAPWRIGNISVVDRDQGGGIMAQEIAHNFGVVHGGEAHSKPGDEAHSKNKYIPGPFGVGTEVRSINTYSRQSIPSANSVMYPSAAGSNETYLFEPADYSAMASVVRNHRTQRPTSSSTNVARLAGVDGTTTAGLTQGSSPVFSIVARITSDDRVERIDSQVIANNDNISDLSPGPYYLVFMDATGAVLAADGVPVSFETSGHGANPHLPAAVFSAQRPMPAGTSIVAIWKERTELARFSASSSAPRVSAITPGGGAFGATEEIPVSWTGSDTDGDALTYAIEYTRDSGQHWLPIATTITETMHLVRAAELAGTATGAESQFRISASDGFNSATALSRPFRVSEKPPVVAITSPGSGLPPLVEGESIVLRARAYDLEDGDLAGEALAWISDLDGPLGSGQMITPTLAVGRHTIQLSGIDSGGIVARHEVQVQILPDFDGDRIPDQDEEGVFWNPRDAAIEEDGLTRLDRKRGVPDPLVLGAGLAVDQDRLTFTIERGEATQSARLLPTSTGAEALSWSASSTAPWLTLNPTRGETSDPITATVSAEGLLDGTYGGRITIRTAAPNVFEQTVPVTLTVVSRMPPAIVAPPGFVVRGRVRLERRGPQGGARVCVTGKATCTTTDAGGLYSLQGVAKGDKVSATHPSYLASELAIDREPASGGELELPEVTLLAGDVDQDGRIYDTDAGRIAGSWGQTAGGPRWFDALDITGDGRIGLTDIVAVQYNWAARAPGPWTVVSSGHAVVRGRGRTSGRGTAQERLDQEPPARISVRPVDSVTDIGRDQEVEIRVENAQDLFLYNLRLSFDPEVLVVEDSLADEAGVQIDVGDFLDPEHFFVIRNSVDNQTGVIDLVVTELHPGDGTSGSGVLGRIRFKGLAGGRSRLHFDEVRLFQNGFPELIPLAQQSTDGLMMVGRWATTDLYLPRLSRSR